MRRVEEIEDIELVEELVKDVDERALPVGRCHTEQEQIHQEERVVHVCIKFWGLKISSHPLTCQFELQV